MPSRDSTTHTVLRAMECDSFVVSTQTNRAAPNAVKAENLNISAGRIVLFEDANLRIAEEPRDHELEFPDGAVDVVRGGSCYGLVGPNGCGKSTLLKLIAERRLPVPEAWTVYLVGQHLPETVEGKTPRQEVLSGDSRLNELLDRRSRLEEELVTLGESEDSAPRLAQVLDELQELYSEENQWSKAEAEVCKILVGLGFRDAEPREGESPTLTTPMSALSGGWRMKVELANALWLKPKLLLLDEPTNHLDLHALVWLEGYLKEFPHTSVVVSHQSSFLQRTCDVLLCIRNQKIERATTSEVSAQALAEMQTQSAGKPLRFHFEAAAHPEDHGLSFHDVSFAYNADDQDGSESASRTLRDLNCDTLRFSGKSRTVLLGRNGSGKSTLLGLAIGHLEPCSGSVDGARCRIGHYSQHFTEKLDRHAIQNPDCTAAEYLIEHCRAKLIERAGGRTDRLRLVEAARKILDQFDLKGCAAGEVPLRSLSGGQKARVNLAYLALTPSHLIFLDEPTNHLDAGASKALVEAIVRFRGGIVLVSHDELLVNQLLDSADRDRRELLVCEDGRVRKQLDFKTYCRQALHEQVQLAQEAAKAVLNRQSQARKNHQKCRDRARAEQSKEPAVGKCHNGEGAAKSLPSGGSSQQALASFFATRRSATKKGFNLSRASHLATSHVPTPARQAGTRYPTAVASAVVKEIPIQKVDVQDSLVTATAEEQGMPMRSAEMNELRNQKGEILDSLVRGNAKRLEADAVKVPAVCEVPVSSTGAGNTESGSTAEGTLIPAVHLEEIGTSVSHALAASSSTPHYAYIDGTRILSQHTEVDTVSSCAEERATKTPEEVEIRKLSKALREISCLEQHRAAGFRLRPNQIVKVGKRAEFESRLNGLLAPTGAG